MLQQKKNKKKNKPLFADTENVSGSPSLSHFISFSLSLIHTSASQLTHLSTNSAALSLLSPSFAVYSFCRILPFSSPKSFF
jgi:hypothetical protein